MDRQSASKARQHAAQQAERLHKAVMSLVATKQELIQGKLTTLLVKCGKKNCRCTQGEKHPAQFLYVSRGGPLRRVWIPKEDQARVQESSERYRNFRTTRAELNKMFKDLLSQLDQLEQALTVPYERSE